MAISLATSSPSGKKEVMNVAARYSLLDARARDLRTIMLAMLAGVIATGNVALGALDKAGTPGPFWFAALSALALAGGAVRCGFQMRKTVRHADSVRKEFHNWGVVPPVDRLFMKAPAE